MLLRVFALVLLLTGLTLSASLSAESAPRAAKSKAKKYALLVGVTEYKHSSFPSLKYTENDVEKLAELLDKNANFTHVRVLSTSRGKKDAKDAPTAANLSKALADLVADKTKDDVILVALAGHGVRLEVDDPDGKGKLKSFSFFCPSDADLIGVSYGTGKSKSLVNLDDLFAQLGQCGAGTKLALIDACRNDLKANATRNIDPDVSAPRGVAALLSCGPGQRAWETEKLGEGHGVFFHYVLEGLKGRARNLQGEVTWLRLVEYVQRQVSRQVPKLVGQGAKQTPHNLTNLVGESPVLLVGPKPTTTNTTTTTVKKPSDATESVRKGLAQIETVSRTSKPRVSAEGFRKALACLEGKFERHDPVEAAKLFRQSAEGGCDLSRAALAFALARGAGVKRDDAEAHKLGKQCFTHVKAAADKGDADAQAQLGRLYAAGLGVRKDEKEAFAWHRKASENGSSLAMLDVAVALSMGRGVAANESEAFGWYRRAAAKNNADAQFIVGQIYAEGRPWVTKNRRYALTSLKLAAARDHREAKDLVKKLEK